jgi:2-polyprenylphenol 6-hydroxylase
MAEVIVVGGGAVGACAAALLRRGGLEVTLLEPQPPAPVAAAEPLDARVVALSRASERIVRAAGAWELLAAPRLCAYEHMCVWHESVPADSRAALRFDAAEVGEPNLGYILENRLLQQALLQAFTAAGGQLQRAAFTGLAVNAAQVTLTTAAGELSAALVIGADGARSAVRTAAGLDLLSRDYQQLAIIANIATARPHAHTAWQRFMKDGTLALLPLADGSSSIVWSADAARARQLMAATDEEFDHALGEASAQVLGSTRLLTPRRAFELQRLSAPRYVASRVALIGDAAHVVHPLAGQGVNLGLLDAAALAEGVLQAVGRREDPGALTVLRAYERWRKSEVALMAGAIDAFDRLLAHGSGPVAQIAQRGLGLVNRSPELKRFFIERALGLKGELPRAARAPVL